ncbi:unnamed protein product [Clonostachys chloroleuca]|uniref:Bacteriophage T5 Orf172 DNA-binding domain-containing protein n=1 Tax=Clonostachys chloroleuca TaxID=1926264 RepID=A0AA35Q042_9HYPO|nr:unnamed protein product [Clonostachys chloroleuca]
MSPEKPMLQELVAILGVPTLLEEIDDCQFISCLAMTKQGSRCGNIKNPKDQEQSMGLWNEFSLMKECILTEGLHEKIQSFIRSANCHRHNSDDSVAMKGLKTWLNKAVVTNSATSEESSSPDLSSASLSQDTTTITVESDESDINEATIESDANEPFQIKSTVDDKATTCIEVEAVAEVLSSMAVTDKEVKATAVVTTITDKMSKAAAVVTTTTTSDTGTHETQRITAEGFPTHIDGFGTVSQLQRKGTLRSPAPFLEEIFGYLKPSEQEEGIVYVLKHISERNLFKIGYTRYNSEKRRKMGKKCNVDNSETIYESPQGHFFAARKAEKLAQVCLRQHNLKVEECDTCGGGHKDWFGASERDVLQAVETMEAFVRLPGYSECPQTKNWKISIEGYEKMKLLCDASPRKISALLHEDQGRTASKDSSVPTEKISSENWRSVNSAVGPETRASEQSFNEDRNSKKPTVVVESVEVDDTNPEPPRPPGVKLGRSLRAVANGVGKGVDKAKRGFREILPKSREVTPEHDSLRPMSSAGQTNGMTMEETIRNAFRGFDADHWSHLGKRVKNEFDSFVADVNEGFHQGSKGVGTAKA